VQHRKNREAEGENDGKKNQLQALPSTLSALGKIFYRSKKREELEKRVRRQESRRREKTSRSHRPKTSLASQESRPAKKGARRGDRKRGT